MDIAERRLPQDGRFTVVYDKKEVDLRVSSLPGTFGEKLVLRLLVKDAMNFDFEELGYSADAQALLRRHITRPQGMVLLTGPTGSGKTTTLYTCLSEIDRQALNVVTLEDPVEYQLSGIHQVHISTKVGLTFAAGLRTILRQDPDVIMVGEIRDKETAEMAIRAALTGHLVLSTLHTNDAMGTLTRLVNMDIEPFLVTEAVTLVGAQRLVRANCKSCIEPYAPDPAVLARFAIDPAGKTFLHGAGCGDCRGIGFRGRVALTEFAEMTGAIRELVLRGETAGRLREVGVASGMITLRDDGIRKAIAGRTTLEEVLRVVAEA
jgi:type II secretory ATPase GspE/PulE/Tfp pilus assembly ATPase PilB-like protein